jgi:hypothetical protein
MRSTMMDFPLTVRHIFEHGRTLYADSEVVTSKADGLRRIKLLRARNAEGSLNVVVSDEPPKAHPAT